MRNRFSSEADSLQRAFLTCVVALLVAARKRTQPLQTVSPSLVPGNAPGLKRWRPAYFSPTALDGDHPGRVFSPQASLPHGPVAWGNRRLERCGPMRGYRSRMLVFSLQRPLVDWGWPHRRHGGEHRFSGFRRVRPNSA